MSSIVETVMALKAVLLLGCALVFLASAIIRSRPRVPKGLRLPPGPWGFPIVGSAYQIAARPREIQRIWAKQYGELVSVKVGLKNVVLINSPAAAKEIMDKRSAITSSRTPLPVAGEVASGGKRINMMDNTPLWRALRALTHQVLTAKSSATFKPLQEFETKQVLYDILTDNDDSARFYQHVRRYSNSVILTSIYGIRSPRFVSSLLARTET